MISKEHQFIFIHIHKTGGSSIEKELGLFDKLERNVQDHRTIKEIEALTDRKQHLRNTLYSIKNAKFRKARKYFDFTINPTLSAGEFERYYKFSFVRNTWSRLYSWYSNIMRDDIHKEVYNITDSNYSFQNFLEEKVNPNTFSQLNFLKDKKGNITMDFIGRFENLQQDFNKVCVHLGIENKTLPKLLVSGNLHYSQFYNSGTKDLVYKLYKEEIDFFNFEYGN
jgi:Sulfotransferase family